MGEENNSERFQLSFINEKSELEENIPVNLVKLRDLSQLQSFRKFIAYKGQRHLSGYYWFSQLEKLIGI
jgi:hypothetical protein